MMQVTKYLFGMVFIFLQGVSGAQSIGDCLDHLGGGGDSDFRCLSQKSIDLKKSNQLVSGEVEKKLKATSKKDFFIFHKFVKAHEPRLEYCKLLRNAERPEENDSSHIRYYDVIYAECIFSEVKSQNSILNNIAKAWGVELVPKK